MNEYVLFNEHDLSEAFNEAEKYYSVGFNDELGWCPVTRICQTLSSFVDAEVNVEDVEFALRTNRDIFESHNDGFWRKIK